MFKTSVGKPQPFGANIMADGVNFAIFSKHATAVILCLFDEESSTLQQEIVLNPILNRTGDIWHLFVHQLPSTYAYAYRMEGPKEPGFFFDSNNLLVDPYAREILSTTEWGKGTYRPLGKLSGKDNFDWGEDHPLRTPLKDLIIYEMHVRGFTHHESSTVSHKGTFLGVVEKIPHLLDLGINAVELMPLQEFNENENPRLNPKTQQKLFQYWGYSSLNFFAPMNRYASENAVDEFKTMVKTLHKNRIEVILDVVFNHTNENDAKGPIYSFKGIDSPTYYLIDDKQQLSNFTGCGNTFNCNHPVVIQFILDCLRYWVLEMHVDGFRFDLASIFYRNMNGHPAAQAALVEAISRDPLLAHTKMIAEPWDAVGLYQVGHFYPCPGTPRWSEWNARYRDSMRRYLKGTGNKNEFATNLCGSQDLYGKRDPTNSINFITAHDGFTLADLVTYNHKHNIENGENNHDGINHNDSWNCGVEGATDNKNILELRDRQMRNFHLALMLSSGVPMLLMGDEYGHSKRGNNNTWCQDSDLNWFLWDHLQTNQEFYRFYRMLIQFRKEHPLLRLGRFLTDEDIQWHGRQPLQPQWDIPDPFIAFTLIDHETRRDLFAAFNPQNQTSVVTLPSPPENHKWHLIVNTANISPSDICEESQALEIAEPSYQLPPYSSLLLKAF